MSASIMLASQPKKPFHHRNGSYELDVFEAAGYFSGATENFKDTDKNINISGGSNIFSNIRPIRRMSLDMPNHRDNSSPLQTRIMENPTMITKEKKFKQPSSPGGKLAHFLNSLFNQTSSKKSKSKKKSTKDEDESPGGWKRKRRSSMSHLSSGNTTTTTTTTAPATVRTATIMSNNKSSFSNSTSSGFRTPPPSHVTHTLTKTTSYIEPITYAYLKPPPPQITKIPLTENLNKIETFNIKSDFPKKNMSFQNGYVEKVNNIDKKQEQHYPYKYVSREDTKEFKKFNDDDEGADSDSSSDLFELTNCDLGYYSSGLPVYKTTHTNNIKTQERCTNLELSV